MSEKFQRIVNTPHRAVDKLRKKIKDTKPEKAAGKVARGTGVATTAFIQGLLWFLEHFTLDNFITRGGEKAFSKIKVGKNKKGQDKKIPAFIKKNPNFTAIVSWWMLLASLVGAGVKNKDKIADALRSVFENVDEEKYKPGTYGAYFNKIQTITPYLIADLIAKEGVHVDENGMHVVYDDKTGKTLKPGDTPKGKPTIGFGATVLKDGTPVTTYTKPITTEEAYELARWHLEEGETYFGMYCYDVAFDRVDINNVDEAFAIGSIMYNSFAKIIEDPDNINCKERFTKLRKLYKEKGRGLTDEDVINLFNEYPVNAMTSFGKAWLEGRSKKITADSIGNFLAGGRGLIWRRWLEAGLLTGKITPKILLECPIGGVYEFFEIMGGNRDAFFTQDENGQRHVIQSTYDKFKEWLNNPVDKKGMALNNKKKVKDYLPDYAREACDGKVCKLGDKASKPKRIRQKEVERETYVLNYETAYEMATKAYKEGDYNSAAKQFEDLSAQNPDNALLHNDLAATYNHLGRYDDAIKHAKEIVKRIGDKSQYAAAQYNAGYAYEQKGDLEKALVNYKLSVANGNARVQSDVTRVKNQMNNRTTTKSKKVALNDGAARVKQRANIKTASVQKIINDKTLV